MSNQTEKNDHKTSHNKKAWTLEQELDFVFQLLGPGNDLIATNPHGIVLRVSELYEEHFGLAPNTTIGRSIYELEQEGIFRPSVTMFVLREKRKVTLVQETKANGKILSTGIPVFGADKKIKYVVAFSSVSFTDTTTPLERFEKLLSIVDNYNTELREKHLQNMEKEHLIFNGDCMKRINETILQIADTNANVMLTGETGVGKSMIARIIHKCSLRASGPFIEINCGAIPETLIESELFGYVGGAFTGADARGKIGMIQAAEGGTLFLDEIGEMPVHLQLRLLQVLQEKKIVRLGSNQVIQVDFRLITATNRDLKHDVEWADSALIYIIASM
jgi:transcriptional regulator with PAS, ATPase and Fis domain